MMQKYRFALIPCLVASCVAASSAALAKPHDIRIKLSVETVPAIHTPTGCVASVEYHDKTFTAAYIVDPLCLPSGVIRRPIPASAWDFHPLTATEAAIVGEGLTDP